jgi:signal peptidase I
VAVKKDKKDMTFKEKVIDNVKVFLSAYAIAFVIRMLLVEAYQIPSQSMVPSLLVKDILMVEKVTRGPIIPLVKWKIPGVIKPQRNDVIVFVHPGWKSPGIAQELISMLTLYLVNLDNTFDSPKNLVKRLVGMPGDRILMTNQVLVINGKALPLDFVKNAQEIMYERLEQKSDTVGFDIYQETDGNHKRIVQHLPPFTLNYSGYGRMFGIMGFPEIVVPKKGDVIQIKGLNEYYKSLIKLLVERESKKVVTVSDGKFYIEGKEVTEWKVSEDHYFGMGDNRDLSQDCRYFGFIPEQNIFGRPFFRYWPFTRFGFDVNEKKDSIRKKNYF